MHYLLPYYANQDNLVQNRGETECFDRIRYVQQGIMIELSETNSLVEDKYSLNLRSANYSVEGSEMEGDACQNVNREAMIHHHPRGHPWKHLQFRLQKERQVIRIKLDCLDEGDYERCIKGFLGISQRIIDLEKNENNITEDLQGFFFNECVAELDTDRRFLLNRIRRAQRDGAILDDNNTPINDENLADLRAEIHLLPFLEWEE